MTTPLLHRWRTRLEVLIESLHQLDLIHGSPEYARLQGELMMLDYCITSLEADLNRD
mgnify:CR=1 FL=1